jgi:DNA-binding CsgD family transcriptional regulator
MRDEATLLSLIGLIYDAAADPALWPAFLTRFADTVGGTLTVLHGQDLTSDQGAIAAAVRMDPAYQAQFKEYYSGINVFMTRRKHLIMRPGQVVTGPMLTPEAEVLESEYYNDFLRPQDVCHLLGVIALSEGSWTCNVSTMRPRHMKPWGDDERAFAQALVPHLQRGLQLHRRLIALEVERQGAAEAMDHLTIGLILLDANGHHILVNRSAQAILDQRDGLSLSHDGLRAGRPHLTAQLRALISASSQAGSGHGLGAGGALSLPRASGKRALSVLVTPLSVGRYVLGRRVAAVAVFVTDPEEIVETPPESLRRLYGLTAAEARLACHLLGGETLHEAKDELGITTNTARTHLKRIFSKTGAQRQSELMQTLLRSPAQIRAD